MAGYIGSKASVVSSGAERKKTFTITGATTSLTGLNYTVGKVHVFQNGVRLVDGTDYTATNGTTITLTVAAQSGDNVVVISQASYQVADAVLTSGDSMSGNLSFGDNDKAIFGAGSDLQIYHDGSGSYIEDAGAGNLTIKSNTLVIADTDGDNMLVGLENGEARLYNNGSQKLATTATGVNVTGTVAATAVTGDGSGLTGLPAGGITEADQWRLTTTFTANQNPITSNWERNDTSGYATLGTGMTESSGTFTFPSTGIYRIGFQMTIGTQFAPNYSTQGCWAVILTTTNNSSYANAASSQQGIYNFSTSYFSGGSIYVESIFDVTNVATHKARFGFGAGQGGESCRGSSSDQLTGVTFMKLGDT